MGEKKEEGNEAGNEEERKFVWERKELVRLWLLYSRKDVGFDNRGRK